MHRCMRRNSGYVLLLTLGIISLASISLAGFARHSLALATRANASAEELQLRWGLLSTRHVLLDRAAQILDAQVPDATIDSPPWPKPAQITSSFQLGELHFSVVLADEDAKLDLNAVYARKRQRLVPAIQQIARNSQSPAPNVLLSPTLTSGPAFSSLGQVFDLPRAFDRPNPTESLMAMAKDVTCWGSSRLNVRRASEVALRETALLALSPKDAAQLLQNRRNWGGHGIEELLNDIGLKRSEYSAASRLLGTESQHFSLWVIASNQTRSWSHLYVQAGKPITFAW